MTFRFTKMHGTGNDYVYVNGFEQEIENPGELSGSVTGILASDPTG